MYGSAQIWWVYAHYNPGQTIHPIMDFIQNKIVHQRLIESQGLL